jgi:class 3 adenylate cyclase
MAQEKKKIKLASGKVGGTRVVSITAKIVLIFVIFILASNFTSNTINLFFNRAELIKLMKQLLVKDLKELYTYANNEYEIYNFNKDITNSIADLQQKATNDLKKSKSVALGILPEGKLLFRAELFPGEPQFDDTNALAEMNRQKAQGATEGTILFLYHGENYYGVYKFNPRWNAYLVRAEELKEFYQDSVRIFRDISIIIALITLICALVGIWVLGYITRYIRQITEALMKMSQTQQLELIDLKGATNDNITFLGMSFNSLSNTINNLLGIFRKFVNRDIAIKAYREREVRLEGTQKDLTILFSDIKSFTFITETLGPDIIKLLNLHYNQAIKEVMDFDGIIGSIIGDAVLAVFGALDETRENKSFLAVKAGYRIQEVAQSLRLGMHQRREDIIRSRGSLTDEEERVYKAVLLEVGVGIDGGLVFYGNIGSTERMTNTVIGDNVNSASRLEGLTRIYHVPVIVSEYVKDEIEQNVKKHGLYFQEIDMVQVKGKTVGKRVYWPILMENFTPDIQEDLEHFSKALALYYRGGSDWTDSLKEFKQCRLPLAKVFVERVSENACPDNWSGVWTMTSK